MHDPSHIHSHTDCNHSHGHSPAHTHGHHGHSHSPTQFGRTFLIAAALNMGFIVAEVIYGMKSGSLALLADAGHNFSDVVGLLLAWGAYLLSQKPPTPRHTYGLRSSSIVAALANALLLLIAVGGIAVEAVQRFGQAHPVQSEVVMGVAALGIAVNGVTAWMFSKGQHDLNIKAAFLHLAADAAVSAGVVVAGFMISRTGWLWIDPAISLLVAAIITYGTWGLLRDSVNLALHAVPSHVDSAQVRKFLANQPGVTEVHDLHIWGMSTTEAALSAHLVMPGGHPGDGFLKTLSAALQTRFAIQHATLQIEIGDGGPCELAPEHIV